MSPTPVQYQVHYYCPVGAIADPQTETQRTRTQGIFPQQSLITVGRLDVDIAFEPYHIVHWPTSVAGHFLPPAQQAGASKAPIGQQRLNGIGQIAQQTRDKSFF